MTHELQIIIVEEASLSRNVLVKALTSWGVVVRVVENEKAALSAVRKAHGPFLIVVDWLADFLDCVEFLHTVRHVRVREDAFVFAAIPRGMVGAIRHCILAGADDVVSRPYDLDEVRVRIHLATKLLGLTASALAFSE